MSLFETVQKDLVTAMKAQDKTRTGALRMLKSALKNAEIKEGQMDDALAIQVIVKMCKQRLESIEAFEKNGRQELADNEKTELAVLETYLPKGLSDDELEAVVRQVVAEVGATSPKQMGQVMGAVLKKLAGQVVDGKKVNEMVKKLLTPNA